MAALREVVLSYRLVFTSLSRNCKNAVPSATAVSRKNYSTAVEDEEKYDVIVTGGGMIGATLACAIGNNRRLEGKKVLLLESNAKQQYTPQEQYSNRVIALNNQARILLSSLGAWQHIEAVRYCPVRKMQVWDAWSDAMITFNEDHLSEELAYIVENDLLLHAINKQLSQKENVTVIYESKITDVKLPKTSAEFASVQLQSGKRYAAILLAIMTGWGATEMGPRSQELLQAKLSLVTNDQCREAYRRLTQIWHKQLCAGGLREVDSCFGDSGGPLQALGIYNGNTARFVQYGVVSFGSRECGIAGVPGVYTRVAYYVDWILNTMTD